MIKDMDKNADGRSSADELAKACNITLQQAQGIIMKIVMEHWIKLNFKI